MRVFVIHGEANVSLSFASLVTERFGFATHVPTLGEVMTLRPPAVTAVPGEPSGVQWEQRLAGFVRKAGEMDQLLAASPPDRRAELLARFEANLARAEAGLDLLVEEAKRQGSQ
jgi:hypothetical protein